MMAVIAPPSGFIAINGGILPVPAAGNPILVLVLVHVNVVLGVALPNTMPLFANTPLQKVVSAILFIAGVGFTVTFSESVVSQPAPVDNVK